MPLSSRDGMANEERVEPIDALRGVAALAVVLYHYVGFVPLFEITVGSVGAAIVAITRHGHLGVPVFFVLSGYVIAMTAARYPFTPSTGARFMARRLVRLAPPYWVMVVLIAGTVALGKTLGGFRTTTITLGQVMAHLAYVQDIWAFRALDAAYWTLALEVQFYLVFAGSLVAVRRLGRDVEVAWFAALTLASLLVNVMAIVPFAWFPSLWYQFGAGVLAYYAAAGRRDARALLAIPLAVLVGSAVAQSRGMDIVVACVAAFLTVGSRRRLPDVIRGPLLRLGRISYSLYLVHGFVGIAVGMAFRAGLLQSEAAAWLLIGGATAAVLVFAAAFYALCERRSAEWSRLVPLDSRPASPRARQGSAKHPAAV